MPDISKFKSVSVSMDTHSKLTALAQKRFEVPVSVQKVIEFLLEKETKKKYQLLLNAGKRSYMTVAQINDWLEMVALKYSPVLTAYNIGFDMGKCRNTGIYLDQFDQRFCLWGASKATICLDQEYAEWCAENMAYTATGRLSTKADYVAQYLDPTLPPEPHTALEDARDYESVILYRIINCPNTRAQILELGRGNPSAKWMQQL